MVSNKAIAIRAISMRRVLMEAISDIVAELKGPWLRKINSN